MFYEIEMRSLCIKKPFELDVDVIRYFSKNRMKIKNVKFVRKNLFRKIESIIAFPAVFLVYAGSGSGQTKNIESQI